jgi:2,3-bisphosphoglycerate-independent phosphoglycerate mutase
MSTPKAIYLISDGLGDRPSEELQNKTPAEFAVTPCLDRLCKEGMAGLLHVYQPGYCVGTDWGHLCLFGYDPARFYTGRGAMEAVSAGIPLKRGDVAFRGNFATVDDNLAVKDRRAGRIRNKEDIDALICEVDGMTVEDCRFLVRPLTEHRLAIVCRGPDLGWHVPDTDPGTAKEGEKVRNPVSSPSMDSQSARTARILWVFLNQVHDIWSRSEVNQKRTSSGLLPANFILTRGSSAGMEVPDRSIEYKGLKTAIVAGDKTIIGIGRMCGFDGFTSDGFTGGYETDYKGKAEMALQCLENHNLVFVHIKATDLCGHDGKPVEKSAIIEREDAMFTYWRERINPQSTYLVMAADHSTPCSKRDHSGDPVPAFLWGPHIRTDVVQKFGERDVAPGMLTGYTGAGMFRLLCDYLGVSPKYGA